MRDNKMDEDISFGEYFDNQRLRLERMLRDKNKQLNVEWREEYENRKGINVKDRFEKEDRKFHNKVRSGYKSLAKKDLDKWKIIDAEEDVNKISSFIYETVKSKLNI